MSNTISVSTLSELYDALASAQGGETIELAGGDYGKMSLTIQSGFDLTFPSDVTIASADAGNPAIFTGLDIRGAANLTFDGVTFDYTFQEGDNIYDRPFAISGSENITIRNSTFDGDLAQGVSEIDDGYGYAIALSFRNSEGVTVENNEFFDFYRGLAVSQAQDVVVTGNDIYSLRMDGMNFAEIAGIRIEDNYIHDFRGSPDSNDHSDMIQFWTNGTDSPSTDIIIRGNLLDVGSGTPTQSIFMRNDQVDQGYFGAEMFYQNLLIEDNVIINGHLHGITVGETNNLTILNNSVLHSDGGLADGKDPFVEIPQINVASASTNVRIDSNATYNINGYDAQSDWVLRNNAFVQDQDAAEPGFYSDVFLASSLQIADGINDFRALPGGMLDTLNAGAAATQDTFGTDNLTAQFHIEQSVDNAALRQFDASFTSSETGTLPEGTTFTWNFGDGTTATGAKIDHAFATGGIYDVSLTVELPDGTTDTRELAVNVAGTQVISYTAGSDAYSFTNNVVDVVSLDASETSAGINLGGVGVTTRINREDVSTILTANEVSINMTLTAQSAASAGEIMRIHGSFVTSVTEAGEVQLLAFTEDGTRIRLTTEGANIKDAQAHDVNISLKDGMLSISVDGETAATAQVTGTLARSGTQDLVFGNPWNAQNFDGTLSQLSINVNESQFTGTPTTTYNAPDPTTTYNAPDPTTTYDAPDAISQIEEVHYAPLVEEDEIFSPVDAEPTTVPIVQAEMPMPVVAQQQEPKTEADTPQIDLGSTGVAARIAREEVDTILGQDSFSISMTLSAENANSTGEVVRLHQSFLMAVNKDGEAYLQAFSEDGARIRLTTDGANLTDMAAHDITVSRVGGILAIDVDGVTMASTDMLSPLVDKGSHDLTFGNPWGKENFDGTVSNFEVSVLENISTDLADITLTVTDDDFLDYNILTNSDMFADSNTHVQPSSLTVGYAEHVIPKSLDRFEIVLGTSIEASFFE